MPWKETGPMTEREAFVLAALRHEAPFAWLCAAYGVSRRVGYKWLERYKQGGSAALVDRPRIARTRPHTTAPEVVDLLIEQKLRRPIWGPKKQLDVLSTAHPDVKWPAPSTVDAIYYRNGLVDPAKGKRRWPPRAGAPRPTQANELWYADHKGYFIAQNRRIEPLTISDGFSRKLLLFMPVLSTSVAETKTHMERVFREFGLPEGLQTDNGGPFGSTGLGRLSKLSVWLMHLDVDVYRSRPGKPTDNGQHERVHSTFMREVHAEVRDSGKPPEEVCERWRKDFNENRPHEGIDMHRPEELWTPSPRQFPARIGPFEYPGDLLTRSVRSDGSIKLNGEYVFVSEVLAGERVGLEATEGGGWVLHVGKLAIAIISRDHRVEATRDRPGRYGREP